MEVLLVNLSLKRFFLKLESSQMPNPGPRSTRWPTSPPIVFPVFLLDRSLLLSTSLVLYVLAGFTVNECRPTNCFCYTLDAVRLLIPLSTDSSQAKK